MRRFIGAAVAAVGMMAAAGVAEDYTPSSAPPVPLSRWP